MNGNVVFSNDGLKLEERFLCAPAEDPCVSLRDDEISSNLVALSLPLMTATYEHSVRPSSSRWPEMESDSVRNMSTTSSTIFEHATEVIVATTSSAATSTETVVAGDCFTDQAFMVFMYTTDDLLLAASMAATVFNVMVIFCAIKLFKRSGDTMHLFILNMTVGDLILTVFCHPNELLIRKHDFLQQIHLCAVVHYFNWIGLAVSGLSLTMLNVDKLIYFRWPLNYDRSMSKQRAIFFCLLIWALSVGFVSYCWLFNIVYIYEFDCSLQMARDKKFYYEIFLILFCVLPVTSSLIVSIYLFQLTRQKRNSSGQHSNAFKTKVKSLVFIFATTAWTSCSLLPYRIMNIARIHLFTWSELSCEGKQMVNWVAWILIYLLTVNPIVNPLITALIYAPYRLTIKKFLVNIPVGNRPIFSYQGEQLHSDSSFVSVRRPRNHRSSSTELASLRQSTEVVRMSMSEPPWTPSKSPGGKVEEEFSFERQPRADTVVQQVDEGTEL